MWIPDELELINFGSHKQTIYKFKNSVATLIEGRNYYDNENIPDSNGSGKSFLIEAVSFVLLGTPLKNIVDSDLIRNDQEFGQSKLKLHNSLSKDVLDISRTIYRKKDKSSEVVIKINDIDQKDVTPLISNKNALILEFIGISREDLLNCYIVSKRKYVSFFYSSNTKKNELIGRFSNSNLIYGV